MAVAKARVPALTQGWIDGLVEAYETKDIWHSLGRVAALLMEADHRRRSGGKKTTHKHLKEIREEFRAGPLQYLSSIVGLHLGYKFALKPLANAVNDVNSGLGRLAKILERLKQPFAVHGTYKQTGVEIPVVNFSYSGATMGIWNSRLLVSKTTTAHQTATALRQLNPGMLPYHDRVRSQAIIDALGLKPSLSALWAVIPRSFVVDWFFPIRDFLEQLDGVEPSAEWFTTLSTYTSAKTVTTGTVREEFAPLTASGTSVSLVGGQIACYADFSASTYYRSALNPTSWDVTQPFVPIPRLPKGQQWVTAAEMLFQQLYSLSRVGETARGGR